ncbi:MAG: hypothetical protein KY410_11015 [Proteobacteria bacterium]|nr:hypothetical protein [Pseudomonadota bacterium]
MASRHLLQGFNGSKILLLIGLGLLASPALTLASESSSESDEDESADLDRVVVNGEMTRYSALKSDTPIMETARSVTVSIYGNNGGRTVTSTSGPRRPRSGGGFTINVTRTVTGGDGKGGTRVFRTTYNPPPE